MRRRGVLMRRAVIVAAAVTLAALAVQIPVYFGLSDRLARNRTRASALQQVHAVTAEANDSSAYLGSARMLEKLGGIVWLCDASGVRVITETAAALPVKTVNAITALSGGADYTEVLRIGGKKYMLAASPAFTENGAVTASFAVAVPLDYSDASACYVISLLCALLAAAAAGIAGVTALIIPVQKQMRALCGAASRVANGELTVRAQENAPGEIGELGRDINRVTGKLAASMYTVIVERNRLKGVVDGLSEGIIAIDAQGQITHTNPAMAKLYGQGKTTLRFLPDARMRLVPDATVWEDFDSVLTSGKTVTRNFTIRDTTIRMTISPIMDELDKIAGAVGLFSDITQMERLERTRREYVSNVSHEMRTPLTAMRALVEPLKDGLVTAEEDRQRYYTIILREVMRLSRLINDQLELSRLQSGTVAIRKEKFDLAEMVYDVCERYDAIAKEKGLALKVLTDFSNCPPVYANEDRAEQLLIILLDNAMKYTEKGSVTVSGSWDDEKVLLSVADTGIGIAEEDLPYVFDRFYKADKAHSGKGSGLGLSIAHELLKRMEEDIWVVSEKGKGTEFTFTLGRWKDEKK